MNLIIFDCDDTLWELPYPEDDAFMNNIKSLNFDFKYKQEVVDIYNDRKNNPNNKFVILTNRTDYVRDQLIDKLKKDQGIEFDYELFRCFNRNKSHRLRMLLKKLTGVKEIEFYDDKEKHRKSIKELQIKFPNIQIKTFKV